MCLILVAIESHPEYPLVIAANRDEFYARPTQPAHFWDPGRGMLAGRDLLAGGTWLGVEKRGRFAAVTNFRDPENIRSDARSRGMLTTQFLRSAQTVREYTQDLTGSAHVYNGYNLLLSDDLKSLYHFSNITGETTQLTPGFHGLSNHLLDTLWPKIVKGKALLQKTLTGPKLDTGAFFQILSDGSIAEDDVLPETGVGLEWERALSPICIHTKEYGTRCSTVLLMNDKGLLTFEERTMEGGSYIGEVRRYTVQIGA